MSEILSLKETIEIYKELHFHKCTVAVINPAAGSPHGFRVNMV